MINDTKCGYKKADWFLKFLNIVMKYCDWFLKFLNIVMKHCHWFLKLKC